MDCQTAHDHLSAYLDHAVPAPTREVLAHHLGVCPQCRRELTQLQTVTAWVRDLPSIEPSPTFLHGVRERIEQMPWRSASRLFRRLSGLLPLQMAAAVMLAVSAVLLFRVTLPVGPQQTGQLESPTRIPPQTSRDSTLAPPFEIPAFEPMREELAPAPVPLVQAPATRPVFTLREEPLQAMREQPGMSFVVRMQSERRSGEATALPGVILRAGDPIQAAQQVSEIVTRVGGALLESWGTTARVGRVSRGGVHVTLSLAADRYQSLIDALRQLPDATVAEERPTLLGRDQWQGSSPSTLRPEHARGIPIPQSTLVITILPR
ncbi:MAG: zf-HC2 domain-containing protein [Nitrospinae bacterium]|nr:zf-HC2 domain-containing protein [Nitrospinota bacterium]